MFHISPWLLIPASIAVCVIFVCFVLALSGQNLNWGADADQF